MKQVYEKQKCDISFDCRWCKIENLSRLLTLYGVIIRSVSSLSTLLFIYFNCEIFTNVPFASFDRLIREYDTKLIDERSIE